MFEHGDWSGRHPATIQLLRWFEFGHLAEGRAREISQTFHLQAHLMVGELPDGPELTAGLRKLLEAKDCCVRAAIDA